MVECRTPEREVGGSKPTAAVLCPWAIHFTPRNYWLITQEVVAPSRHDWKIVDWDVKPQHKSLSAWRKLGFLATQWAHSEGCSDWADVQLIWVFAWRSHFVGFVMRWLIYSAVVLLDTSQSTGKPTKWQRIYAVWWKSLMLVWRDFKSLATHRPSNWSDCSLSLVHIIL